jgi:AcrR family transcriptional regulator
LNRKAIVDAAIRILDVDGLDGFTMRRVADALGTGPASLYWHVGSKDGLLDLVFDEVIGAGWSVRARSDRRYDPRLSGITADQRVSQPRRTRRSIHN